MKFDREPAPRSQSREVRRISKLHRPRCVPRERCVVIEDSIVGLRAAVAAGMPCIITPTSANSTSAEEFIKEGAVAVVDTLGEGDDAVTAASLFPAEGSDVPVFSTLSEAIATIA